MPGYNELERRLLWADEAELRLREHLHIAKAMLTAINDDMRLQGLPELELRQILSALVIAVGRLRLDEGCKISWRASQVVKHDEAGLYSVAS